MPGSQVDHARAIKTMEKKLTVLDKSLRVAIHLDVTPAPESPEILRTKPVLVKFGNEVVSDVHEYEQPDGSHPISPGGEDLYGWTSPEEEAQNKANAEMGLLAEEDGDATVQDVAESLQRGLRGELAPEEEDLALLEGRTMMAQLRGEGRITIL